MLKIIGCSIFLSIILLGFTFDSANADSIKLKNGSYFEGRIIEERGDALKMKLGIGIVEFRKSDIEEVFDQPEVETRAIERQWGLSGEEEISEELSEEDELEKYLNRGKVKYQGRWISEEVHEVLKKEEEIKEKRYRFLQQKKKRDEQARNQRVQAQLALEDERKGGFQGRRASSGHLSKSKTFGKVNAETGSSSRFKTRVYGSGFEKGGTTDKVKGSRLDTKFGGGDVKSYATTSNPYSPDSY